MTLYFHHVEDEARLNNAHVLDLEVTVSNESTLKLYVNWDL